MERDGQKKDVQQNWLDLIARFGNEDAARDELARQLRTAADIVAAGNYPGVFGCKVWSKGEFESMETVSVTLSLPWGG